MRFRVSIPQWCDCCCHGQSKRFVNPLVSIPQWCDCCHFICERNSATLQGFNPTMVRLLLFHMFFVSGSIQMFQSHNGAIAAQGDWLIEPINALFQSHNGAIAAATPQGKNPKPRKFQSHNGAIAADNPPVKQTVALVSIPQWCDCCPCQVALEP